ncbi:hypothetical protein AALO_G00310710 [Alosa alosa]|uniref:Uncharacterized protein n=1 Tax=Alosa alosa TaxID=278164 RepID=A0AAV6FFN3_9TELE|nr:hypothetical protein AALO_G00310710 [Alosa alosa]
MVETDATLEDFFNQVFMKFDIEAKHQAGLKCMMSLVQKIDNYVSEDVVKDPNCGVLKLKPAEDDVFKNLSHQRLHDIQPSQVLDMTILLMTPLPCLQISPREMMG